MYFNDRNEDTNIDSEFKKKKTISLAKLKKILIISAVSLIIFIIILIIIIKAKNKVEYFITLEGEPEISIFEGTTYNEPGYNAYDSKDHNLNNEVKIETNLDEDTVGIYTIRYILHDKYVERTINVIEKPAIRTVINLKGEKYIAVKVGETFNDPGVESAVDMTDGDITNKVTVKGTVDTSKKGTNRITYSVTNSRGETTTEERIVEVK